MSRETCFDCVRKHLAQAAILLDETQLGYPHHFWLAVGHLAEAESESLREKPELSGEIRTARMDLMNHSAQFLRGEYQGPSMDSLICRVCEVIGDVMYLDHDPRNSKKFEITNLEVWDAVLEPVLNHSNGS